MVVFFASADEMQAFRLNTLKSMLILLLLSTFVFVLDLNLSKFSSATVHERNFNKTSAVSPTESLLHLKGKASSPSPRVIRFSKALRYVQRPWAHVPECANFTTRRTLKHFLPPIALASYPGSGNTWVRGLIELASGIYTGSLYKDANLYFQGFWGETADWDSGMTCVQKTHDSGREHIGTFSGGKGILLSRNPYEAILSFHNFLYGGHTGFAPSKNFNRKEWPDFLFDQTRRWLGMTVNWTLYANELLVVHYEDVKENPVAELRRILTFLDLPVDEERLACIEKYPQAHKFQRKKSRSLEQWSAKRAFPEEIRPKVDRAIRYVNYLWRRAGQRGVPFDRYSFYAGTERTTSAARQRQPDNRESSSLFEWSYLLGSRVVKSFVDDPLTNALREEAELGAFYAWRVPFERGYNETEALESDFNSGPPLTFSRYKKLNEKRVLRIHL